MKLFKSIAGFSAVCLILFGSQTHLTSCKKEIIHDTIIIFDSSACYDLTDGLVAYYNFNKGSLNDSSGSNNHIYFNSATKTTDRFGRADNAYLFNGTSSHMRVKNSASLNPNNITLMAIVKFHDFYRGPCHANQIVKKGLKDQLPGVYGLRVGDLNSGGCLSAVDTSKEIFSGYYGDWGSIVGASDPTYFIKANQWNTVVYSYDGHHSKIYVNGVLKNTVVGSSPFHPNTYDLFIGRAENPDYPYWVTGVIDEVRIYNRALCDPEVKLLSNHKN